MLARRLSGALAFGLSLSAHTHRKSAEQKVTDGGLDYRPAYLTGSRPSSNSDEKKFRSLKYRPIFKLLIVAYARMRRILRHTDLTNHRIMLV